MAIGAIYPASPDNDGRQKRSRDRLMVTLPAPAGQNGVPDHLLTLHYFKDFLTYSPRFPSLFGVLSLSWHGPTASGVPGLVGIY